MVEWWGLKGPSSPLFLILDNNNQMWLYVNFYAAENYTEYTIHLSGVEITVKKASPFFPMQWTRLCFFFNANNSLMNFVVDGNQLEEMMIAVDNKPDNLNLILGWSRGRIESPGRMTDVNIFSSPLSAIEEMTKAGTEKCGASGDFVNWEETTWTLHSKAFYITWVDSARGPCRRESKMHVYPMIKFHYQSHCMQHCEKFGGQSLSVKTHQEWQTFPEEIPHTQVDLLRLPKQLWLSATEGDKNLKLTRLDHWPEGIEANETVWRDFYTGEMLDNYTKPWETQNNDTVQGDNSNCIIFFPHNIQGKSWREWQCGQDETIGCPCSYKDNPILRLRGFCPTTLVGFERYPPIHRQDHQDDVIMVGWLGDQLGYNSSLGQWIIQSSNQFIYTGYMSNNPDDKNSLSDIFCLAHQWLLEDLVTICPKLMSERVSASNVFQLLDFAKQYDNDNLSNCAKRFSCNKSAKCPLEG